MTKRKYYSRTFCSWVWFYIDCSEMKLAAELAKESCDFTPMGAHAGLVIQFQPDQPIVVWVESRRDVPTIAHECLHATNVILSRANVKADFNNDEAQAYLLSELVEVALGRK